MTLRLLRLRPSATSTSFPTGRYANDYAQLYQRLRLKRSYAAGFTATKRTGSVQVAQDKLSTSALRVKLLIFDFPGGADALLTGRS
ncbi:MAG: hypothetical protein V7L20_18830 [Nostoc sp.]